MERIAIYTRVSTDDQDCQRQLHDLRSLALQSGGEIVLEVTEVASGSRNDRAERAKVIELARQRKITHVLVTELSRWSRSVQDLLLTLDKLASWGVSLVTMTGMSLDLNTTEGRLMVTLMGGIAQFERDLIRDRVKSGLAAAKRKGKVLGRKVGQRPTAKYDKRVIRHHEAGRSIRWIATDLQISAASVQTILKRHKDLTCLA